MADARTAAESRFAGVGGGVSETLGVVARNAPWRQHHKRPLFLGVDHGTTRQEIIGGIVDRRHRRRATHALVTATRIDRCASDSVA